MREDVIRGVERYKIIGIVRGVGPETALPVAEALYRGGIRLMELPFDQSRPETWDATARAVSLIAEAYEGRLLVGAGTVTSPELVDLTAKAGGEFIVSPDTDADVIQRTRELGLVSIPGALTATEVRAAWDAGADFVKVFPAGTMGPGYIRALKVPFSHIRMLAVAGMTADTLQAFLDAGACGVGISGNLSNREWIARGEYEKLTAAAEELTSIVGAED